jgi:ribosomal protein L44E
MKTKYPSVRVYRCGCPNSYQDEKYGHQMRLLNKMKKKERIPLEWRCTSCGKVHSLGEIDE